MNKLLILQSLILLISCDQTAKSGNAKADTIETSVVTETSKTDQKTTREKAVESLDCTVLDFNSPEQQADSLLVFMEKAINSSLADRIKWEQKFFCAFPNSFKDMQSLFGYDDENGAAPLYSRGNETFDYANRAITNDVIGFFSGLELIPDSIYYDKYIRINIDGYWEADHIQKAFGFSYCLMSDTKDACKALSTFSDKEIKSVFRFIFDGPYPKNDSNENLYEGLKTKIGSQDNRLSLLLTESYEELMAEDDGHGH